MVDSVAMYNRSLSGCKPFNGKGRMIKSYLFQLLKSNDNAEIPTYMFSDRDFAKYATAFEKEYSTLVDSKQQLYPVIGTQATNAKIPSVEFECLAFEYPVIGHIGWVDGYSICGTPDHPQLADAAGNDRLIVRRNPPKGYTNIFSSEERFFLVTDVDGRILWWTKEYDPGGRPNDNHYFRTAVIAGARKALGVSTMDILTIIITSALL
jgi:hypothetical protein